MGMFRIAGSMSVGVCTSIQDSTVICFFLVPLLVGQDGIPFNSWGNIAQCQLKTHGQSRRFNLWTSIETATAGMCPHVQMLGFRCGLKLIVPFPCCVLDIQSSGLLVKMTPRTPTGGAIALGNRQAQAVAKQSLEERCRLKTTGAGPWSIERQPFGAVHEGSPVLALTKQDRGRV